jgi:hypothetical protein
LWRIKVAGQILRIGMVWKFTNKVIT